MSTLAQQITEVDGVSEVFSVAGQYDLIVIVRVSTNEALADVVSDRIRKLEGITSTETLIAFQVYSRHDLERVFSLGFADGGD